MLAHADCREVLYLHGSGSADPAHGRQSDNHGSTPRTYPVCNLPLSGPLAPAWSCNLIPEWLGRSPAFPIPVAGTTTNQSLPQNRHSRSLRTSPIVLATPLAPGLPRIQATRISEANLCSWLGYQP